MGETAILERIMGGNSFTMMEEKKFKHRQRQGKQENWKDTKYDYYERPRGWWFSDSEFPSWPDAHQYDKLLGALKRMKRSKEK